MLLPRLLCISPYDPRDPQPSAGTVFLQHWLVALTQRFSVTVLTSDGAIDRPGVPAVYAGIPVVVAKPGPPRGMGARLRDGLGPSRAFRNQVLFGRYRSLVDDAEIIEVHWPSMIALLPDLRHATRKPLIYITYDLRTEALFSLATARPVGAHNPIAAAKLIRTAPQEIRSIRAASLVLCFRESERRTLRRWLRVQAETLQPVFPTAPFGGSISRPIDTLGAYRLGFVADMTRVENRVSLAWFSASVWPQIRRSFGSGIELHVFGRHGDGAYARAHARSGITWHGWVDDISAAYASVDVAVAPLRVRGGIKFKVAEALAHGVPVIGTSIAASGYPLQIRRLLHIANSPDEWEAALQHLKPLGPSLTRASSGDLRAAVENSYNFQSMAKSHMERYLRLAEIASG